MNIPDNHSIHFCRSAKLVPEVMLVHPPLPGNTLTKTWRSVNQVDSKELLALVSECQDT